jgi:hypothetical protein
MLLPLLASLAFAQEEPAETEVASEEVAPEEVVNPWDKDGFGFGGLPAINFNSDSGFGYGVLASVYKYDGSTAPYKWSTTLLLYKTTKNVHVHRIDFDLLDAFEQPLRLTGRAEFYATLTDHYCGTDPAADYCPTGAAEEAADALDLEGTERDDFVRRYYKIRQFAPNGTLNALYKVNDFPHKLEIMAGWYGQYLLPGSFTDTGPWPGSKMDEDFPGGQQGFWSTLQLGASLDNRDNEPAPTTGYWAEASLRGGSSFIGSDWDYWGYNVTLRGYASPFGPRAVFTTRAVADGMFGDVPATGLSRPGGRQIYSFYGGQRAGRGVRSGGVIGKARFMDQMEVRLLAASPEVMGTTIDIHPVGFFDAGYWAEDHSTLSDGRFVYGYGGGLRLAFNKNFIIRADLGFSPLEDNSMQVYIDVRNLW